MTEQSNHRTRWTQEETAFLMTEWDGHRNTTEIIAELLGRTTDAVQQRHYEIMWGNVDHGLRNKPTAGESSTYHVAAAYRSITFDAPTAEICNTCWCYKAPHCNCD